MKLDLAREAGRILTAHPYAGGRSADLAKVLEMCSHRFLSTDEVLCTEGDRGEEAFFLLRGTVRVLKNGSIGADQELAQIQAPALLGHMSLIDNSNRSATCVAADPCEFLVLDRHSYGDMLTEPSARGTALRRLLLSSLTRQLISGNTRLQGLLASPETASSSSRPERRRCKRKVSKDGDIQSSDLLRAAGVLEGWQVDTTGLDDLRTVEDEDMRRSRLDPKYRQ